MSYREKSRRNLYIGVGEGVLATPWVFLSLPGAFVFAALLTQYYGLSPAHFGLVVSMPAWANALQLFCLPVVAHFLKPREMTLGASWLNLGLWLMLVLMLPLIPREGSEAAFLFVAFFAMASLSLSLIGVGWTSWVQSWVPDRIRGRYFGRRNRLIHLCTIGFLFFAMFMLDWGNGEIWPYQAIIGIALAMRFFSILWQHLIEGEEDMLSIPKKESWVHSMADLWHYQPFRTYLAVAGWTAFWMSAFGPFSVAYGFEFLEVSTGFFARIAIVATLGSALAITVWGKLVDRYGPPRMIMASLILWWVTSYTWVAVNPANAWLLYPASAFAGAMAGGFFIGMFNLLYKVAPRKNLTAAISLNMALSSLAAATAPVLVGWLLNRFALGSAEQALAYRAFFALATTMMLLSVLLVRRVPTAGKDHGLPSVLGTMRAMRMSMVALGMAFFANSNSIHLRRRNKRNRTQ